MINFNNSSVQGRELDYITESIKHGQISGDSVFSKKCENILGKVVGCKKALLTTSCTHALELSSLLLKIKPGEEVILPAFTFASTANAFILRGAKPVFCDIRPDTLNIDETKLEKLINPSTRVIVPVHYAGVGCEMDTIMEIANRRGIAVVEDNAHGLFGKYKGRYLGTFGCMASQSFHQTKNITCGEGGALIINDKRFIERAEIIREKGTNRSKFFRGEIDKYSWVDIGSSYIVSDVLAAFLYGQLEQWQKIQNKRQLIWRRYNEDLLDWTENNGVGRPVVPGNCEQAWHMYYLLMPTLDSRKKFISRLKERRVTSVFHYLPLNKSTFALQMAEKGWKKFSCPITEDLATRIVRLPFYTSMSKSEQTKVIDEIKKIYL